MKNITVTVGDETYRKARIKAAERDTSVSALVKHFLTSLPLVKATTNDLNARSENGAGALPPFAPPPRPAPGLKILIASISGLFQQNRPKTLPRIAVNY